MRKGKWKLLAEDGVSVELFDFEEDPHEQWSLMKDYPELTEELTLALNKWLAEPRMEIPY